MITKYDISIIWYVIITTHCTITMWYFQGVKCSVWVFPENILLLLHHTLTWFLVRTLLFFFFEDTNERSDGTNKNRKKNQMRRLKNMYCTVPVRQTWIKNHDKNENYSFPTYGTVRVSHTPNPCHARLYVVVFWVEYVSVIFILWWKLHSGSIIV